MKTAMVTGANGHIGCHVARSLLDAGWAVRAFVRSGADLRGLAGLAIEVRTGDLLDSESVARAMPGTDVVFHVGASHKNFAPAAADIIRPAVEGTVNVLEASRRAGVSRIVYTSSAATVGFTEDPSRPLTESSFLARADSVYTSAKIQAEAIVREHAAAGRGPEVVILNPSGVFGPRDYRLTPATRALVGLAQGDPSFLHVCATDVRDVGRAHLLAAEHGKPGERYIITGEVCSPSKVASLVSAATGHAPKVMTPPKWLLMLLAKGQVWSARRRGTDAGITPDQVRDVYGRGLVYDSSRSRAELGMTYRPAGEVFVDAYRWLLFMNALRPRTAARVRVALGAKASPDEDWSAAATSARSQGAAHALRADSA